MIRKTHRMIALLCVLCMLFTCMPVSVLSDDLQPATPTDLQPVPEEETGTGEEEQEATPEEEPEEPEEPEEEDTLPEADREYTFCDDLQITGKLESQAEGEAPDDMLIRVTPEMTQTVCVFLSSDRELEATVTNEETDAAKELSYLEADDEGRTTWVLQYYKLSQDSTYLIRISGKEPAEFSLRLVRMSILKAEEEEQEESEEEQAEEPEQEQTEEPEEQAEEPEEEATEEQEDPEATEEPEESEEPTEIRLEADEGGIHAAAVFLSDAGIPADAVLQVREPRGDEEADCRARILQALDCADESYLLYARYLGISFLKDGEAVVPEGPVQFFVSLPDAEDSAQTLQAFAIGDTAVPAGGTLADGAVSWTGMPGVYGIVNALQPLKTEETELVSVEVLSLSSDTPVDVAEAEAPEVEEGLEVLGTFAIEDRAETDPEGEEQAGLWIRAELKDGAELDPMESVSLMTVENGETEVLVEDLAGENEATELEARQVAVVKDTGYRHLTLTLNPDKHNEDRTVTLDGMMPKDAEATAVDVTEQYADHVYPQDEPEAPEADMANDAANGAEEPVGEGADPFTGRTTLAAFDISISSGKEEYQPDEERPVCVEITDSRITADADLELWHIKDDGTEEQVTDFTLEEGKITFIATGFSAYAIVEGPGTAYENGWHVATLSTLRNEGDNGFYISLRIKKNAQPNDYYFLTGGLVTNVTGDSDRNGLEATTASGYTVDTTPDDLGIDLEKFYFIPVENGNNQFYVYKKVGETKNFVQLTSVSGNNNRGGLTFTTNENSATPFTFREPISGHFSLEGSIGTTSGYYWNRNNKTQGFGTIAPYKSSTDDNIVYLQILYKTGGASSSDPYELDGKAYGLMFWNGGIAGKALMASQTNTGALDAKAMEVLVKEENHEDRLFVPSDSEITDWTFHWIEDDFYRLSANVDGEVKYLKLSSAGLSLADTEAEASRIQVVPGTGAHVGQIYLKAGNVILTYSGKVADGFTVGGSVGREWLNLVEYSELSSDYLITYSAKKIGVSEKGLTNGSQIIVYARKWNDTRKRYDFYAVDHDGTLVPCYESGDTIQWLGDRINTKLWDFVEYYWEGTTDPNYYYELYNEYSQQYIAPQVTGGQTLSPNTIGINLDGRKNGYFYSPIIAWDEDYYAYAALKADTDALQIVSCAFSEADDFYFAILQDPELDDDMTLAPTVDNREHGITMKIKDFGSKADMSGNDGIGHSNNGATDQAQKGLLSNNLTDGYPTITHTQKSLGTMMAGATVVNHLFLEGTYNGSGYYTYDSTQNFATLRQEDGTIGTDFRVYRELGTYDRDKTPGVTMQHGQFLPFNDLKPGVFAKVNELNLYDALRNPLSENNPRRGERLYDVRHDGETENLYFAVELEASFIQTPSGKDNWGHDIIYEFTGDDDFWLYVDGELVIDLGGMHYALFGSVNYHTGAVNVNGTNTTLYDLFRSNYMSRGHSAQEAEEYLNGDVYPDGLFTTNHEGNRVFKDYTTHTMKIFYMERGGGASNLNMRFNLASVKEGHVELSKEIEGVDNTESLMAEFPYQIWYRKTDHDEPVLLTQDGSDVDIKVYYKNTITPVTYKDTFTVDGVTYPSVFLLKPGEVADIAIPDEYIQYRIIECGLNTDIYHEISPDTGEDITVVVNEGKETVHSGQIYSDTQTYPANRRDYYIDFAETKVRTRAAFVNSVDPEAMRTLTIRKNLFDTDGTTPLDFDHDSTTFGFRLYLASELDDDLTLTDKYTYHVLNPDGVYCVWDAEHQRFAPLGENKTDYTQFTRAEKQAVTFHTSMNGSISKIPATYTVQIRELMVSTQYKVEERKYEIPDGYSLRQYNIFEDINDPDPSDIIMTGQPLINKTIEKGKDPEVVIDNVKGFGLRAYKEWNDADYMERRDPAYFAVYRGKTADEGDWELVPDTVQRLAQKEKSVYWYFQQLGTGFYFEDYHVREVTVTNPDSPANDDGILTDPGTVTMVRDGATVILRGRQKGEVEDSDQEYTVRYTQGTPDPNKPNIREDHATNSRQGLVIRKEDWEGNGLEETTFVLQDADYTEGSNLLKASYTSLSEGDVGYVTTAFLRKGASYTLTETKTKTAYLGLKAPLTISVGNDGGISVTGVNEDSDFYALSQDQGTLTIKNKPFTFSVSKFDKDTDQPLAGAVFELHKQITVGGVTTFDFHAMDGYTNLTTDLNGIIPRLDQTLPAGTYELREMFAPMGYVKWTTGLQFTVNGVGRITLGNRVPDGTELVTEEVEENNRITFKYTLRIPNGADSKWPWVKISKKLTGEMRDPDRAFRFTVTFPNIDAGEKLVYYLDNVPGELTLDENHQWEVWLRGGQTVQIVRLPLDTPVTVTEDTGPYDTSWKKDGAEVTAEHNALAFSLTDNTDIEVTNNLYPVAPTGYTSRNTPYLLMLAFGLFLTLLLGGGMIAGRRRKRRLSGAGETGDPGPETACRPAANRPAPTAEAPPCPRAQIWREPRGTPGKRGGPAS